MLIELLRNYFAIENFFNLRCNGKIFLEIRYKFCIKGATFVLKSMIPPTLEKRKIVHPNYQIKIGPKD